MMKTLTLIMTLWCSQLAAAGPEAVALAPEAHRAVVAAIGATEYQVETLHIPLEPGGSFTVEVDFAGQVVHLDLSPWSVRGPGFAVRVSDGRGGLVGVAAPPVRTVRGVVRETGDAVAGALLASGLKAMVATEGGTWSIGPVNEVWPARREVHFVVHSGDEFLPGGTCPGGIAVGGALGGAAGGLVDRGGGLRGTVQVNELSAEADYELFVRNGGSVDNTVADVEMVVNGMNIVYERDVAVTHLLGEVLVRTSEGDDPYFGVTESGSLLDAFRQWWNQNQGGVHRDLTHLFTGKELDGSTIGLAYLGVVCDSPNFSYGLSETRFRSALGSRVGLTAHEIGHNFSASHCGTPDCHIMCPTLGGCNGLGAPNFGPGAIGSISNHVAGAGCLKGGQGQPLGVPLVDTFPLPNFDSRTWSTVDGVALTDESSGEPSPPYVALFDRGGSLMTDRIDMTGPFDRPLSVRFWAQAQDAASGENLELTFMPEEGLPVVFGTVTPPPNGFETVGPVRFLLPPEAIGTNTHIGWRSTGSGGGSDWAIDDVRIAMTPPLDTALLDGFEGTVIDEWNWPVAAGAVINAGSPDPPSPPFVLNLDNTDRVESRVVDLSPVPSGEDVWVWLDVQSNNVEASKSLRLQFWDGGQWSTAWQHAPRSTARSPFAPILVPLPEEAEHDELRIRLQALGSGGDDDWFIDDIFVARDDAFGLPIVDDFDDAAEMISPTNWHPIEGAVINGGAAGEPSGSSSLNLDSQDRLSSRVVDLSGVGSGNRLVLRMWLQSNGVDAGQRFYVDYRNAAGSWANGWSIESASSGRETYGDLVVPLPGDALHEGAQIRLRVAGVDGSNDWFVDSFRLAIEGAPALPVRDEFVTTVLDPLIWASDDNVAVNSGALNEPSPPYSMNLDRSEFAITQPVVATSPGDGVVVRFWLQHNGVEPGKRLYVEYTDAGGVWRSGETFTSASADRVTYGVVNVGLGANAAHDALQVRLRVDGVDGSDDWFVDDLEVIAFDGFELPIFERFATTRLDRVMWVPRGSVVPVINQGGVGEPSDPYVLNLDKAAVLETGRLRGVQIAQRPMVRFWMQHNGVEPGETLKVDWLDASSSWNVARTLVSESASRSAGEYVTIDLPPAAAHNGLRLRFRVSGEEPNDDWFLDDIAIESKSSLMVPFAEDFEEAAELGLRNWSVSNGIVTQSGANEPSGSYSMRFGSGGRGVLWPMDLEGHAGPLYARFWAQYSGGVSAGNSIAVSFADAGGTDQLLGLFRSGDAVDGEFVMFEVELPPEAMHDAFALELVATLGAGAFMYIDDVQVDGDRLSEVCAADLSGDGALDFFDLQLFLNAFAGEDPIADFNADGEFDFFDLLAFLAAFGAGCP